NRRAWKALELALAGDTFWERCKVKLARSEDQEFRRQVRAYLDAVPLPELANKTRFRQQCLDEIREAGRAGALTGGDLDARLLTEQAAPFASLLDPTSRLRADQQVLQGAADLLAQA